jgi:hypothetical protein
MIKNLIRNIPQILIRYRSWLNAVFQAGLIFLSLPEYSFQADKSIQSVGSTGVDEHFQTAAGHD